MENTTGLLTVESIRNCVYTIRGQQVMLDYDLAHIYGYETRTFNQQIKNNVERFDEDFNLEKQKLIQAYDPVKQKLCGLNLSYCFKDAYTSSKEKQRNNQVHTRSLHAEENAFLQLAKYGTQGIKGGKLFTTASCCELCSKKAYQLGIREIYYIDSYPGISRLHILESGVNRPKMILFRGAIGRAYVNLYTPFLPLKDEIEELTEVNVKSVILPKSNTSNEGK